jgi:hypothetical protein
MRVRSRKKAVTARGKAICTIFGMVRRTIDASISFRSIAYRLLATGLLASLPGCANPYDPVERVVGGGLVGAGAGAAIGAAAGGGPGAALGAAIGGATGVIEGAAATLPPPGYYGYPGSYYGYPGWPYGYPGYVYGYPYIYPGYYYP